jgi:hypothetical protein
MPAHSDLCPLGGRSQEPCQNEGENQCTSRGQFERRDSCLSFREGTSSTRGKPHHKGRSQTPRNPHSEGRSTPRISDKERTELLAVGKCFNCKETGHLSRNCPHKSTINSPGSRPPGASSFNIELFASIHESDESVEVLDSLPLGAVFLEDEPIDEEVEIEPKNRLWLN